MNFDHIVTEAMSIVSYMDVSELRLLYYGRLGVNVAFSDNADIPKSGFEDNRLARPWSIRSFSIENVVGRKASSHLLYGHVFRVRKKSTFIEDIKSYSMEAFKDDISALEGIGHINPDHLEEAVTYVSNSPMYRYPFARLWDVTKLLSTHKGQLADKYWRRVLRDLGYTGFNDPSGVGVLGRKGQPCSVLLEFNLEEFDIVPVQKYRKDNRQRIIDNVNKKNSINQTRRNRVAKRKTAPFRTNEKKSKFSDLINSIALGGI